MTYTMPDIFYQDQQLTTSPHRSASPGEQSLWQRVIVQLLTDAMGKAAGIGQVERQQVQRVAISWFTENGRDFHMVCYLAGFEPEWVRDNVMKLLKEKGVIE